VGLTDYIEFKIGVDDSLSFSVELVTVANMLFLCCIILLCAPLSALPLGDRQVVVSVCVHCHWFLWPVNNYMHMTCAVWVGLAYRGAHTSYFYTLSNLSVNYNNVIIIKMYFY